MAATAKKTVTVVLGNRADKKSVVRFDAEADNAALANVYVTKDAMKTLGDPQKVKVTIEAA